MTHLWSEDAKIIIEKGSRHYPAQMAPLASAPQKLYVRGNPDILAGPCIAIVGTRRPTPYGLAATELAARVAVESDVTVVSGGAMGCDQAAGRETLAQGGRHIIVLGTGADVVYPSSCADLIAQTLKKDGAVVSIAPWGTQPRRFLFPKRNAVIAALSQAVFIGEAGMPSGTFSTAESAMEYEREVLAVPGSIYSPESRGANYLISLGACCIADEEALQIAFSRIFGVLNRQSAAPAADLPGDALSRRVLRALVASPLRSDEIARLTGLDTRACLELISDLMVAGRIEQQLDGRYAATKEMLHALTAIGQNGNGQHA